jgi:hypothetical protein
MHAGTWTMSTQGRAWLYGLGHRQTTLFYFTFSCLLNCGHRMMGGYSVLMVRICIMGFQQILAIYLFLILINFTNLWVGQISGQPSYLEKKKKK